MAFVRAYYFDYKSLNGFTYRLEIFQDGLASAQADREGRLGKGGCNISYGSSSSEMFAPIKASTMTVPFVVGGYSTVRDAAWIRQLRTLPERSVYGHLYRETVNGTNSPVYAPIFSGYMLADIGDEKDQVPPYVVNLKFVDGLAALKMFDFVPTTTTQNPNHVYEKVDTWIPDANNTHDSYYSFQKWIYKIMQYSGYGSATNGRVGTPLFSISNKFYNGEHPSTNIDPLNNTRCNALQFYEKQENNDTVTWRAKNAYECLQAICTVWGMRVIFWKGTYYFIQISEYQINESGTMSQPDDIKRYIYNLYNGSFVQSSEKIGTWWSFYDLQIHKTNRIRKLAGGNRNVLPKLKKVSSTFFEVNDYNHFVKFPELPDPWPTTNTNTYETESLGVFTDLDGSQWYQEIWLSFNNTNNYSIDFQVSGGMVARPAGTNTWTKMLYFDWSTGVPVETWANYNPAWQGGVWPYFNGTLTITPGQSMHNLSQFGLGLCHFVNFPTGNTFAGDWELGYQTKLQTYSGSTFVQGHGFCFSTQTASTNANAAGVSYANTTPNSGINSSIFCSLSQASIGNNQTQIAVQSSADDTSEIQVKNIWWGDSWSSWAPAHVQCYNGSAWVTSAFSGLWGYNTTSGNLSLTKLLCVEIMNHQGIFNHKEDRKLVVNKKRYFNDGNGSRPVYINPLGKFTTYSSDLDVARQWILHSGSFNTATDEWTTNLYEYKYTSVTTTTTTTTTGGTNSGGVNMPSNNKPPASNIANPNNSSSLQAKKQRSLENSITTLTSGVSYNYTSGSTQTITTLNIKAIGTSLLKTGDKVVIVMPEAIRIFNDTTDQGRKTQDFRQYTATINSNQSASDTTLTIETLTLNSPIPSGSSISINNDDLIKQYQHKTRGTIGGLTINETSLGTSTEGIYISNGFGSELIENNLFTTNEASNQSRLEGGVQFADWTENPGSGKRTLTTISNGMKSLVPSGDSTQQTSTWHQRIYQQVSSDLVIGEQYKFVGEFRTVGDSGSFRFAIQQLGSTETQTAHSNTITSDGSWVSINETFTCDNNTSQYVHIFPVYIQAVGASFEVRNISLKQLSTGVGIGTETPSSPLQVAGTIIGTKFSGELDGTISSATTAATQSTSDNSTKIATTAFVTSAVGSVPKGLQYQGTWNAETNSPTITSGSGTVGHYYIVATAGTTTIDGISEWAVGDWIIFTDHTTDHWQKIDQSESDTLQTVTTRGNTTTENITVGNLTTTGAIIGDGNWDIYAQYTNRGRINLIASNSNDSTVQLALLTNGNQRMTITKGGTVNIVSDLTIGGTVDGRNVSADGTQLDTNTSSISTNTSNISTNTSNISTNTSDISTKASASSVATNTSAIALNTAKTTFPGFGTSEGTALQGNTTTITSQQAQDIQTNNAKTGITNSQASAITANTAKVTYPTSDSTKVGNITVTQAVNLDTLESNVATNNSKVTFPGLGTTSDKALAGNTTTISSSQASAITTNTAKTGISSTEQNKLSNISVSQAVNLDSMESDISTNSSKTGITSTQASAIVTNTAKTSYPSGDSTKVSYLTVTAATDLDTMRSDVSDNNAKTGITSAEQTKLGNITITQAVDLDTLESNVSTNNSKVGITNSQASAITANTAKNSYPSGDETKVGHITVTQAVDLDTMETDIAGKVSLTGNETIAGTKSFSSIINSNEGINIVGGSIGSGKIILHTNNLMYIRGGSAGLMLQNGDGSSAHQLTSSGNHIFEASGEKMRLVTGGQLLIGHSSSYYAGTKLQVGHTTDSQNGLQITTSTSGYGYILFGDGTGADAYVGQISYKHSDNTMRFRANATESFIIKNTGIDIAGNIVITGTVDGRDVSNDGTQLDTNTSNISTNTSNINLKANIASPEFTTSILLTDTDAPDLKLHRSDTGQLWNIQVDSSGRLHFREAASLGGTQYTRLQIDDTGEITSYGLNTISMAGTDKLKLLDDDGSNVVFGMGGNLLSFDLSSSSSTRIRVNNSEIFRVDSAGNLTLSGTVDGIDIAARDAVLTSTTSTATTNASNIQTNATSITANSSDIGTNNTIANAALPKAGGIITGNVTFNDTKKAIFGTSDDGLEIYHSGNHSYIRDVGTGSLYLQTNGSAIYLQDTDGNAMAQFTDGGGSFLMYNGNLKLSTTNTGIDITGEVKGDSLDIDGNADISGNLSGVDLLTVNTGINQNIGITDKRDYYCTTGSGGGNFLIGQIELSDDADGAIAGVVYFSYDYGTTTNNCTLHFNFAQRSGTARGTWWYEGDDQDTSNDRVKLRLIDDGSGGMYVWLTTNDYAGVLLETRQRHIENPIDSGTLTSAATVTTGTTLFDTSNDPTAEMHIGKLYAHDTIESGAIYMFSGDLTIPGKIVHADDSTTWIGFDDGNDTFRVVTNAGERFGITNSRTRISNGDLEINGGKIKIYNSGSDYWGIQTDSNGKLEFDQNGTLRLEASSGEFDFKVPILGTSATFSGDVIATDGSDTSTLSEYGLTLSRSNSYIQSNADNSDTLNIGQPTVRWGHVKVDSATFKVLNGGNERLGIDSSGNATFAGDVKLFKTAPTLLIEGDGVTSANLKFKTNTVDRWNINVPSGQTNLAFTTGSTNVLSLDTSNNATFAGDVTATANYTAGNSKIIYKAQRSGGAVAGDWSYDDATTDMSLGTSTAHSFSLKTGNTRALTINSSQNATFAGDVLLNSSKGLYANLLQAISSAGLKLGNDDNSGYIFINDNGKTGVNTESPAEEFSVSGGNIAVNNGSGVLIGGATGDTKIGKLYNVSGVLSLDGDGTRNVRLGSTTNGMVMFVDNTNDRVGFGTDSPAAKLDVFRGSTNGLVAHFTGNNAGRGLNISTYQNSNHDAGVILDAVDPSHGTLKFQTSSSDALTLDVSQNATFAGIVSVPTGKSFRLYNTAGTGWGELSLEESENKIQFNRGIKPTGNLQSDQTLGTSTKRWHTLYSGAGNFTDIVTIGDGHTVGDDADDNLEIKSSANENIIIDGADRVILRDGGSTKLETSSSGISITGTATVSSRIDTGYGVNFTGGNTDFLLYNNPGEDVLYMRDITNASMITNWGVNSFRVYKNLDADAGIDVTGNITVTGTVDGIDIATRDAVLTSTTNKADTNTTNIATNETSIGTNTTNIATNTSALSAKAPINNPTFTGSPAAPTAPAGTNNTKIATTAFVTAAVSAGAGSTVSRGSFTPSTVQTIGTGGTVGTKSTLAFNTSKITAVGMSISASGILNVDDSGDYMINLNFGSTSYSTHNRIMAAAQVQYSEDEEEWTNVAGSLIYNYDRGTATGEGGSTWGTIYEGSGHSGIIDTLGSDSYLRVQFWIESRSSSSTGIQTVLDACRLSVHKIA